MFPPDNWILVGIRSETVGETNEKMPACQYKQTSHKSMRFQVQQHQDITLHGFKYPVTRISKQVCVVALFYMGISSFLFLWITSHVLGQHKW